MGKARNLSQIRPENIDVDVDGDDVATLTALTRRDRRYVLDNHDARRRE